MAESGRLRLDAFLARAGVGTRSEVRRLIRRGRVALDGVVCRSASQQVQGRTVTLKGEVVTPAPGVLHCVLNKPVGYACSHDEREAPIIDELLPAEWSELGLEPAGRLDRDTSGLLVLSTDGALIHRLTHPSRKLEKRYRVRYEGALPEDAVARCAQGLMLRSQSEPTHPARLVVEAAGRATIHLAEGRYHQVRRMFAALGVHVVALHRDRVGRYELPADLEPGALRPLEPADLEDLCSSSSL
jgi:16S rRNA pseudouridine516 synthase